MKASSSTAARTTAANPPSPWSHPNSTSDNHSQANQGAPGLENENKSWVGTAW